MWFRSCKFSTRVNPCFERALIAIKCMNVIIVKDKICAQLRNIPEEGRRSLVA